jgi:hypothetical protein
MQADQVDGNARSEFLVFPAFPTEIKGKELPRGFLRPHVRGSTAIIPNFLLRLGEDTCFFDRCAFLLVHSAALYAGVQSRDNMPIP